MSKKNIQKNNCITKNKITYCQGGNGDDAEKKAALLRQLNAEFAVQHPEDPFFPYELFD